MSRIGKLPISLPKGVEVNISDTNVVTVKGPLGELQQEVNPAIKVKTEDNQIIFERGTDEIQDRSMHGLYRALISNMVVGVSKGYQIDMELVGVGYRASHNGQVLEMALGYSHQIFVEFPKEISVETKTERGKNPMISLKSIDKQLLGQVAAKVRSLRKPEPFKGKGIRYTTEQVRRKAGKAAAAK